LISEGYRFNQPLLLEKTAAAVGRQSFFSVDSPQVVIDTVKKAEDSDEIIVRMYESFGAQANVSLKVGLPVSGAVEVNLLEQETGKVDVKDGAVALHFGPFQLMTLKLKIG
jgi:alpha-mannosidase